MSNRYILAIDNGTQSVRALLFDLRGNLVDKSQVAIDSYQVAQPGWLENDPEAFWQSVCTACQRLWASTAVPRSAIAGVVITTQRGTTIALDQHGQPLRPAKVWWQNDDQLRFVLREGKKRQIRRMCDLVGLRVLGLKRIRIGKIMLGDLPQGQWRYLAPGERFD